MHWFWSLGKGNLPVVLHFPPYISHEVMTGCQELVFSILSFKPAFHSPLSPSSRGSLIPPCFLPLEWYHLHIWGCWYFSWESWFQLVLHLAQHFCMMYSVYKLNKQGDNIQPWHTLFPIWTPVHCLMSSLNCYFLTFLTSSFSGYR